MYTLQVHLLQSRLHLREMVGLMHLPLNLSCPERDRDIEEWRIVCHMVANTQPVTKAICDVALSFCVRWTWCDIAVGPEMPRGIEVSCVFAIYLQVAV